MIDFSGFLKEVYAASSVPESVFGKSSKYDWIVYEATDTNLAKEFRGSSQYDWIVYDSGDTKLFCIAIWKEDDKWVLGEFVNVSGKDVKKTKNMGFMTMIEAAMARDEYFYNIADFTFDPTKEIVENPFWNKILAGKTTGKHSLATPIDLGVFLQEMNRLVGKSTIWTNF